MCAQMWILLLPHAVEVPQSPSVRHPNAKVVFLVQSKHDYCAQ